jgi:predicted Ser/Thr protein kinase
MNVVHHITLFDKDEIDHDTLHARLVTAILINFPVNRRNEIASGRGVAELVEALIQAYQDGRISVERVSVELAREVAACKGYYMFTPY